MRSGGRWFEGRRLGQVLVAVIGLSVDSDDGDCIIGDGGRGPCCGGGILWWGTGLAASEKRMEFRLSKGERWEEGGCLGGQVVGLDQFWFLVSLSILED